MSRFVVSAQAASPADSVFAAGLAAAHRALARPAPVPPSLPDGVSARHLPFAQGNHRACAVICVEVACTLLSRHHHVLRPPLDIDEAAVQGCMKSALRWWEYHVRARKNDRTFIPMDTVLAGRTIAESDYEFFSPGHVATASNTHNLYSKRETGGWVNHRTLDVDNLGCGMTPRLVDELIKVQATAADDPIHGAAAVWTAGAYTRLLIFRGDHIWAYDSHGAEYSWLYNFESLQALLVWMLKTSGIHSEAVIADNVDQLYDAERRAKEDCAFDPACAYPHPYELVVLTVNHARA